MLQPGKPPSVQISELINTNSRGLFGTQETVSENHPGWRRNKREQRFRFSSDYGGPFTSQKRYVVTQGGSLGDFREFSARVIVDNQLKQTTYGRYAGSVLPYAGLTDGTRWPPYSRSSDAQLDAYGTTAIARCKPANAIGTLATSLIELRREGLPKLAGAASWKARTADAHKRAASGEYLNFEFGYKPLANEVATAAAVMVDADRLINQYYRDAGKFVRRRYAFPPIITVTETTVVSNATAALMGPSNIQLYDTVTGQGRVVRRRETTRRVCFQVRSRITFPSIQ